MGVSINAGIQKKVGLFPWENPIKMDDNWRYPKF